MPRTTLNLDTTVLRELKERARREGKPLGQLASELLAHALAGQEIEEPAEFDWYTQAMHPLVDLDDKEAVNTILDRELIEKLRGAHR